MKPYSDQFCMARGRLSGALALGLLMASVGCNAILGNEEGQLAQEGVTGGAGGDGGGGGTAGGGGVQCMDAAECPGAENECQARACIDGMCTFVYQASDSVVEPDEAGDCSAVLCDGEGGKELSDDPDDVFDDDNECTIDACSAGVPMNSFKDPGEPCGDGEVCDGAGSCVECSEESHCPGETCQDNKCIPLGCTDQTKNFDETGEDCGGPDCNPCPTGEGCIVPDDCQSGKCDVGFCAPPTCDDGIANGMETDVDCGGGCPDACGPGEGCMGDGDCTGGQCTGTTCAPTCTDGVKNGQESDLDCGGPVCGRCELDETCFGNNDCSSGFCFAAQSVCDLGHCGDGELSGDETDVDCGGSCKRNCGFGKDCDSGADCNSGICTLGACL